MLSKTPLLQITRKLFLLLNVPSLLNFARLWTALQSLMPKSVVLVGHAKILVSSSPVPINAMASFVTWMSSSSGWVGNPLLTRGSIHIRVESCTWQCLLYLHLAVQRSFSYQLFSFMNYLALCILHTLQSSIVDTWLPFGKCLFFGSCHFH